MNWDEQPLETVKISDLTALQRKIDPEKVASIRQNIRDKKPGKAPRVFRYNGKDYIADGHHRVEAAHLEGIEEIPVRVKVLPTETVDLENASLGFIDPDRPFVAEHSASLAQSLTGTLAVVGRQFSEIVTDTLNKADDTWDKFLDSLETIEWEDLDDDDLADTLKAVNKDTQKKALAQVGVNSSSELTNQVNKSALEYSKLRAGELISPKGLLITATKEMIKTTLSDAIAEGLSSEKIAVRLQDAYAFSPERATLIAMTESARANSYGALEGYMKAKAAGVAIRKSWVMRDEHACEECQENEAQGAIELEEAFASGDQAPTAHPHCHCVIVPILGDTDVQEVIEEVG